MRREITAVVNDGFVGRHAGALGSAARAGRTSPPLHSPPLPPPPRIVSPALTSQHPSFVSLFLVANQAHSTRVLAHVKPRHQSSHPTHPLTSAGALQQWCIYCTLYDPSNHLCLPPVTIAHPICDSRCLAGTIHLRSSRAKGALSGIRPLRSRRLSACCVLISPRHIFPPIPPLKPPTCHLCSCTLSPCLNCRSPLCSTPSLYAILCAQDICWEQGTWRVPRARIMLIGSDLGQGLSSVAVCRCTCRLCLCLAVRSRRPGARAPGPGAWCAYIHASV